MSRDRLLRSALLANAAFSALTGGAMTLASAPLAAWLGLPSALPLLGVGPGLLLFAAGLVHTATRPEVPADRALAASIGDFGWVLGTGLLLGVWPAVLGAEGRGAALLVAVVVALFGSLQLVGLIRSARGDGTRGPANLTMEVSRTLPVSAGRAWPVISDLAGYAKYAPNLSFSRVLDGSGVGLLRECGDPAGGRWTEACTLWEEGHAFAMEVRTDADDYPYPMRRLRGEWRLEAVDPNTSRVTLRFDVVLPGGPLGSILGAVVVAPKFRPVVDELLINWEAELTPPPMTPAASA